MVFIFYLHAVGAVAAFTKRWQEEGLGEGILGVAFMTLIFSVGWTISTFLIKFVISEKGFSKVFDRDALSLILLTTAEIIFYYLYFKNEVAQHQEEESSPN